MIVRLAVPVPEGLVAPISTVVTATVVGIPLISPVSELTDKPSGSPDAVKLTGELLAVMTKSKAAVTRPVADRLELVITGVAIFTTRTTRLLTTEPEAFVATTS